MSSFGSGEAALDTFEESNTATRSTAAASSQFARELAAAVEAVRAAGERILTLRDSGSETRDLDVRRKQDGSLVTRADHLAEREILSRLTEAFPEDDHLSEEQGGAAGKSGRLWVVDPLDGTTNFSRGLPYFAVSVALWEKGAPAVGVVYLPVLGELFTATRDGAAALDGREIRVSGTGSVHESMVNVYFDRHAELEQGLEVFTRVARSCEGRVKVLGSTASLLCYVACGRLDGFVKNRTKLYDFAAGALVLERAGGRLTDFAGEPLRGTGQSLLASNGRIHDELRGVVNGP